MQRRSDVVCKLSTNPSVTHHPPLEVGSEMGTQAGQAIAEGAAEKRKPLLGWKGKALLAGGVATAGAGAFGGYGLGQHEARMEAPSGGWYDSSNPYMGQYNAGMPYYE